MADNKQYIIKKQENGTVLISEDVIIRIVSQAVCEVHGVVGVNASSGLIGKRWSKGVRVTVDEYNAVVIDVDVVVNYGHSVLSTAAAAQKAVINAVQAVTGVENICVHVNVNGIVRQ